MPTLQLGLETTQHCEDDDCTDPWRTPPVMLLQHGYASMPRFRYHRVPILGREFRILRRDMRYMGRLNTPRACFDPSRMRAFGGLIVNNPSGLMPALDRSGALA